MLNWDLTGAALATIISNNLLPVLLWIYVYFVNPASLECWGGFTKAAFTNWGPMAKLAVPGIVMVETEWLAFVRLCHVDSLPLPPKKSLLDYTMYYDT